MRVCWAAGAVLAMAFGCGKGSGGGAGGGSSGAATLTVQVSGRGSVQATGLPGDCHAGCSQSLPHGTQVHLVAAPDPGARFDGWQGACSGAAACDLTVTQDAQVTAAFSDGAAILTVVPVGTGTGHITSTPAGIDCPGTCAMQIPSGISVSLTPRADPGSAFRGWGAGCSGPGGCTVDSTASRTVFVDFALAHNLAVTVDGTGSVVSSPAGINCPGVCVAAFANGDPITLSAVPQAGAVFIGWTGACASGSVGAGTSAGTCAVTLSADAAVAAKFVAAAADDCAGVVPASLGSPVHGTITGSSGPKNFCDKAASDLAGNVAGLLDGAGPGVWSLWSSGGARKGTISGTRKLLPQAAGYQGIGFDPTNPAPAPQLFVWNPDGTAAHRTAIANASDSDAFAAATGGSVVLVQTCASGALDLTVQRFDPAGALRGSVELRGAGCADSNMAAIGDDLDRTLVVLSSGGAGAFGFPPNHVIARWLAPAGTPLTDWFDVGALSPAGPGWAPALRPLIGGGAVLISEEIWLASFQSGVAAAAKVPAFVADRHDLRIVRGKKAYALVPFPSAADPGSLDLFSAGGRHCGGLQVKAGARLQVGEDGTVMALSGADGCEMDWWSGLLR